MDNADEALAIRSGVVRWPGGTGVLGWWGGWGGKWLWVVVVVGGWVVGKSWGLNYSN